MSMHPDPKNFLSIIARCKNEPFVSEFVQHYLYEGVDQIVIFDDGSDRPYPNDVPASHRVTILRDDILFTLHPTVTESVLRHAGGSEHRVADLCGYRRIHHHAAASRRDHP